MSDKVKTDKKDKKIIIIGICILFIILIGVIIFLVTREKEEDTKRNVVVTKDNVEEVIDGLLEEEYIEPGYYSASMSTEWHFATGDAISEDAYVENLVENTNDVYFDVFLADDEDDPILKSPILPRGSQLEDIALDKALSAGTYECVMVYHLVDEEQNTVSTLRVGLTIIIEN
ncbi:MAG: hypothetical protein HFH13_01600 [Dorea sp.]|nr:hypothetical protein [Dorea sp.]